MVETAVRMDQDAQVLGMMVERINAALPAALQSQVDLVREMGAHSLLGHGKRVRPLLFVLASRLCGYEGEDVFRLSTVFECIHAASLLHDDVLDHADTRRRLPTANRIWGNHAAVLQGDFLYAKACALAVSSGNLRFLERIMDTSVQMAEGQILELVHSWDWALSKKQYMRIIVGKTAGLISASCACGAIMAGAAPDREKALSDFGFHAGVAFQLVDDLLDYASSPSRLGKPAGKDLREGKVTLPLIYALEEMEVAERDRLLRPLKAQGPKERDMETLITLVREGKALGRVREEARLHAQKAETALRVLPPSSVRDTLLALNRSLVERTA